MTRFTEGDRFKHGATHWDVLAVDDGMYVLLKGNGDVVRWPIDKTDKSLFLEAVERHQEKNPLENGIMNLFHKLRDKFLNLFGIDDVLDEFSGNNVESQLAELKRRDSERAKFAARMEDLIDKQKFLAIKDENEKTKVN